MDRLTSIVVGVDFSPASASAVSQGVRMAAWNRAKVRAVHVVDLLSVAEMEAAFAPLQANLYDTLKKDALAEWKRFAGTIPGAGDVTLDVVLGSASASLLGEAGRHGAGLLVMGMQGMATRRGVGTTATRCVRHAGCPVLLAQEGKAAKFSRVVVGVDFSETSRQALERAIRVAAQDGSEVHAVHVFSAPWLGLHFRPSVLKDDPAAQAQYRDVLRERLGAFCRGEGADAAWAKVRLEIIEHASHGVGLAEYVRQSGADLLVIGTRGKTNLRDMLMGSTAERVVREAPCSVLTIPPRDV